VAVDDQHWLKVLQGANVITLHTIDSCQPVVTYTELPWFVERPVCLTYFGSCSLIQLAEHFRRPNMVCYSGRVSYFSTEQYG
jgi:hypothetical protein